MNLLNKLLFKNKPKDISQYLPPGEKLKEHHIKTYGKFSRNRMWQLDIKIRRNEELTDEERSFCRVCLMQMHLKYYKEIFDDDNKCYDCSDKWKIN
jgi:hypothetical protein